MTPGRHGARPASRAKRSGAFDDECYWLIVHHFLPKDLALEIQSLRLAGSNQDPLMPEILTHNSALTQHQRVSISPLLVTTNQPDSTNNRRLLRPLHHSWPSRFQDPWGHGSKTNCHHNLEQNQCALLASRDLNTR